MLLFLDRHLGSNILLKVVKEWSLLRKMERNFPMFLEKLKLTWEGVD